MKSYCLKQRKQTECVPGTEQIVMTKNGRKMLKCKCAECGIIKNKFVPGTDQIVITENGRKMLKSEFDKNKGN